ncbi:MAG TPA: hypothetical protein VK802_16110 [Streptosporangiaceae bacterium]|nr:hypothetical protein [Streptosporangiaceae bacterium]
MSPQSRRRDPAGDRGHRGAHGAPPGRGGGGGLAGPPPNALFAEMLRAARELLAVRSPLDAELMVSELLGTWWGHRAAGSARGARRRAGIEELIGEGLVRYAAEQGSPAALALLSGIACLGTSRQAIQAEYAALALMDQGVARPAWAQHVGAVEAAECYVNSDAYGDRDEVVCVFSYAGQEQHALVVVVDYNAGGLARDGWVTSQVAKLLDYCRDGSAAGPTFMQIDPPQARRILAAALAATEAAPDPTVSSSFPSYHAFIRARVRTLPPVLAAGQVSQEAVPVAPAVNAVGRRAVWRKDRRAMLVAEFLASDDAEDLSDRQAASRCADHIVDYGCDRDFGRPLRVSPAKAETFLLDWLPRKVVLSKADQEAMPHVLLAWVRWAGARSGLDGTAVAATLEAVFDAMRTFPSVYRDPASFGLEPDMVSRLLPDGDLEALARRVFAFPLLRGSYRGTDLATLGPATNSDRRTLLAADHDDADARHGRGERDATSEHMDRHIMLADRLWRGDPPELWDAAQRLLDLGEDRHEVLHVLIETVRSAGPRETDIAAALADLPPEEPG